MAGWAVVSSLDTPTSGSFTFTSLDFSTYAMVQVVMSGIAVTSDATDILVTLYVGGVEQTSAYTWGTNDISSSGSLNPDGAITTQASFNLPGNDTDWDVGNATGEGFGGVLYLDRPASTALHKRVDWHLWETGPTGAGIDTRGVGVLSNTGAINGIKVTGSSNLTAGKVRILGL